MRIKVSLKDAGSADGNHLPVGKPFDIIAVTSDGFYIIDDSGKVYRSHVGLDDPNVWGIESVTDGGEEVFTKPSPPKTAPAKHADVPDHKETKGSHRAHGSGHKE